MATKRIKLIWISLICLFTLPVLAQERIEEGEITVNNRVYSVSRDKAPKRTWVRENNEFIQKYMNDPRTIVNIGDLKYTIQDTLKVAVIKVLGRARIAELVAGRDLTVRLYFDYTGKIKAIEFRVPPKLFITIEELDQINSYLKENFSFKMPENIKSDQKIPALGPTVNFEFLLTDKRI